MSCSEWLQGSSLLLQPQSEWSKSEKTSNELPSDFLPVKSQVAHVISKPNKTDDVIERFIIHCCSLYKLKKLIAWLLRFKLFFQRRAKDKAYNSTDKILSVTEFQNAENSLIRYIQHKHFPECFSNKQCKLKSLLRSFQKLQPIVVDGVLRVGGRLKQAPFDLDIKHPIILPHSSHFTELVIRHHHTEVGHSGSSHTWALLRHKFWIIKGAAAVR